MRTIIDKLIEEGIAQNQFQASHIANGLKLYMLRTDEERIVRAKLYRDWRNSKAFNDTKSCYEMAIKGEKAPPALIEEAKHKKDEE